MKYIVVIVSLFLLQGCATHDNQNLYYETVKSINRDKTAAQMACWNAVVEISKSESPEAKMAGIALAKECKGSELILQHPKSGLFR